MVRVSNGNGMYGKAFSSIYGLYKHSHDLYKHSHGIIKTLKAL